MLKRTLPIGATSGKIATRIGVAALTRLAFNGADLGAIWNDLLASVQGEPGNAAAVMDMSVVAQLMGNPKAGSELQDGALAIERLYRSPPTSEHPRLRLLVLAGATDIGGNIPVEFLTANSDIDVVTLYIVPGAPLPDPLPDHDIALVALGNSDHMIETLEEMEDIVPAWPRQVLNDPSRIFSLERDRFYTAMQNIPGVVIPKTVRISRPTLEGLARGHHALKALLSDAEFPIIVRPVNSHAGHGLEKVDDASGIETYLAQNPEQEFFISRFVDYSSEGDLFRKYRVVFIDGRAFACHMAIAQEWKVWYLNADMGANPGKRAEEALFMQTFDETFALRHDAAFKEITARIGLDYFGIDCAETKDGKLLLFEGETAMIVHDMDPAEIYPYKVPQMRKLFSAFVDMLYRRAKAGQAEAA